MTTYSVLICDDHPKVGDDWTSTVRKVAGDHYSVKDPFGNEEVQCATKELLNRQAALRDGRSGEKGPCLFDEVDILVLDYDLLHIDKSNARHTGEALARFVRMFSTPQVVVVVNQFREAQFDLSLRGHLSSHADLNVDAALLHERGLWTDPPWDGFRPWHWQTLCRAVETQKARQSVVKDHLDEPIIDVLGMQNEDINRLSDTAFGYIASKAKDVQGLQDQTFKSFFHAQVSSRDASKLLCCDQEAVCRFLAARVGKWLERQVLGAQDVLVDVPHLIQRYPFLLGKNVSELEAWNATIHDDKEIRKQVPSESWFNLPNFLTRSAVWRQRFEDDVDISRTRQSFDFSTVPPFVFLEDMSTFVPIEEAQGFRAGHHNAFDRRFAKCMDNITYAPQRRLAFAE